MIKEFIFPICTILLLLLFFLGVPELDKCSLDNKKSRKISADDLIIIVVILVVFSIVDFVGLGNTVSVESFENMSPQSPDGNTAYIELSSNEDISAIALFTGVGDGDYIIDISEDGASYSVVTEFRQSFSDVLKWHYVTPEAIKSGKYLRIYASGTPWLGELVFLDSSGNAIPYSCTRNKLNDEQELVQTDQNYLNSSYFDEIYHARTAWEYLNGVYPYETSHPPLGKILISIGVSLFGMTPFGWRFSGVLTGIIMLPVIYILAKKMFGSTRAAVCCTLITATDFMHFVQTRIATIDSYPVLFILLMYLFMYDYTQSNRLRSLAISGIFFGIGIASKWTCFYAGAGLAVIWGIYWIENRKEGIHAFLRNCVFCIAFFVLIPALIYYLSYMPVCASENIGLFSREYFNEVINSQKFMFSYHSTLVAEHPYSSVWYQWIFDIRPILYYLRYNPDGTRQSFGAFVNPVLCWGGLIAIIVLLYTAIARKDKTARFIIIAYLAQLVPWMFVKRLTFEYHYFACTLFLSLALGYVFTIMEQSTKHYKVYIYSLTALSAVLFVLFYPALSGIPVNNDLACKLLGWLPTWPF